MKPSIGRIVHYNSSYGVAAAIVTHVHTNGETVNLQVFRPDGQVKHMTCVEPGKHLGGWNWPPRE